MKKLGLIILTLFIVINLFLAGCSKVEAPKEGKQKVETPPKKTTQGTPSKETPQKETPQKEKPPRSGKVESTLKLKNYFPVGQGYSWKYKGEGNEYASFTSVVVYTKGNLAQIKEDNGGSVTAAVYKSTDEAITRIFFRGEEYSNTNFLNSKPNDNLIVLKAPLKVGTKWQEPNGTREIVDINAKVATPAGTFDKCVLVKITSKDSTVNEYYKAGIGLVKQEFIAPEGTVTSTLEKYSFK